MMRKLLLPGILSFSALLSAAQIDFTDAAIILPEKNNRNLNEAASVLKSCMDRLSGGKTRILTGNAGNGKKICLHLAAPDSKYGKRFWQIKQKGDSLHITGRSPSSLIFGVADFLARAGFYALTWDCDALPESGRLLAEKDLDVADSPVFGKGQVVDGVKGGWVNKNAAAGLLRYRQLNYLKSRPEDDDTIYNSYGARNVVHNLYQIVSPARYAKTHPEYFSLDSRGVRSWKDTDHLCFSNPEVRRTAAENLIREIASHRKNDKGYHPVYYSISQNDCGGTFCHCGNCQALVKHYGGETGLLLDFVNEVAGKVAKVYPDVKISTEAYVNSEKPLKTIKPAPNVIIRYCDVYSRSDFRIPLEKQPERLRVLKEWAEMCPGLAIWDYLNFAKSSSPETAIDSMVSDLRLFRKLGAGNILLEYEYQFARIQNFIGLQQFLAAQLLKNPGQDAENLIRIYLKSYYGKVAPEMMRFLSLLRKQQQKYVRTDSMDFLKKTSVILHKALVKTGNDPVLKMRVLHELNNVDFCLIRMLKLKDGKKKELAPLIAAYRKNLVYALEQNALLNRSAKNKFLKDIQAEIDMQTIDFDLPEELKNKPLRAVRKLGLSYFFRVRNSGAELVSDPLSEMHTSVTVHNQKNAAHKLPFFCGYYDWNHKKGGMFQLKEVNADNRYHWYKLGQLTVGPNSVLWCHGSWGMMTDLRNIFVPNDGLIGTDADPNVYECWVSLRFNGPAYSGKKTRQDVNQESGVWLDKVLLVSYKQ